MSESEIIIDWKMPEPTFLEPESYTVWRESNILQLPEAQSELEKSMDLPAGTLAVLNKAFTSKYRRNQGWLYTSSDSLPKALEAAGHIYKRGVYVGLDEFKNHNAHQQGQYHIHFGDKVDLRAYDSTKYFLIVDKSIDQKWQHFLPSEPDRIVIEASEIKKNLDTCAQICRAWSRVKNADTAIIVGGGIVSDIASFAAHLLGKSFVLVPSTVLAIADACVGGKTGVNFPPYGKNQVGAFAFPEKVHIFTEWLTTLSERELRAGLSECVKHALIAGDDLLLYDLNNILLHKQYDKIAERLSKIIKVKAEIIARDPEEKNERASLNLGHTLAHALEAASQYSSKKRHILHGEAVGLGLLFTCILSHKLGKMKKERFNQV